MATRLRFSPGRLRGRAVLRDPAEGERASPLELFFDLTFVVAVNRASAPAPRVAGRPRRPGRARIRGGLLATWWAWMNFTWFSSTHDADDVPRADDGELVAVGTGSYVARDA